jgi:hypothetical protein
MSLVDISASSLSQEVLIALPSSNNFSHEESPPTSQQSPQVEDGEQALESHEVIELQTFSERKAWIEEKIKVILNLIPTLKGAHSCLVP